ncbi:MAG: hypothetical protein K2M14_02650 [Muribaculaceae bacterium]|nr:hypothetical protein [Bacteroidales bacterium]MDE6242891.1 hypothetical protein [Muribaculaceae bacterium]
MANKREFKKYINTVCDNIVSDMTYASYTIEGADKAAIDDAVISILKAGAEAIMKSNVKFDKTRRAFDNEHAYTEEKEKFFKALYRKVNKEFADAINEAIKKFNAAIPEAAKQAQKA